MTNSCLRTIIPLIVKQLLWFFFNVIKVELALWRCFRPNSVPTVFTLELAGHWGIWATVCCMAKGSYKLIKSAANQCFCWILSIEIRVSWRYAEMWFLPWCYQIVDVTALSVLSHDAVLSCKTSKLLIFLQMFCNTAVVTANKPTASHRLITLSRAV